MASFIAGIHIPDSRMAVETTEFIRDTESPLLFHHSRRTYLFAMIHGELRGLKADPELLYVGAMFHDLGLVEGHRNLNQRFEVDGADAARDFLASHGVPEDDIRRVWSSIALHTTHGIPEFMEPEIALVAAGVETDVDGAGLNLLDPEPSRRSPRATAARLQTPSLPGVRRRVQGPTRDHVRQRDRRRPRALPSRVLMQGPRRGRHEQRLARLTWVPSPLTTCSCSCVAAAESRGSIPHVHSRLAVKQPIPSQNLTIASHHRSIGPDQKSAL